MAHLGWGVYTTAPAPVVPLVQQAIKDSFPFKPLPAGSPSSVDIEFTFDYNVFRNVE